MGSSEHREIKLRGLMGFEGCRVRTTLYGDSRCQFHSKSCRKGPCLTSFKIIFLIPELFLAGNQ